MERRFELRKEELMADCEVHPAVFAGMMSRLERFAEPFAERLRRPEQREHAQTYVWGLLSDVQRKNAEAIAYRHDQDRQGLQTFIGTAPWGPQTCPGGTDSPSRPATGRKRRGDHVRSVGLSQEGQPFGRRGAAVVRALGQGGQLPSGRFHGLRFAHRAGFG